MTIGVWVGRPDGAPVPGLDRPRRRRRRSCSTPSRAAATRRRRWRMRPRARSLPPPASCRRRCSVSAPTATPSAAPSRRASCSRPTARASNWPRARRPEPVALKIAGGAAPLTVMVNGVPLAAARRPAHAVLRARRPGLRAAHRDGRPRRHRQRHRPPAIAMSSSNDSARAWAYGPAEGAESALEPRPMSTATNDARQSLAPGARPVRGARLCRRLAPARGGAAGRLLR